MGRHERHKAKISEYLVSRAIEHDGNVISDMIDENYIQLSEKIVDKIKEDYTIKHVEKVGNEYDSIGDIMIKTDSDKTFIEIKITESGGTLGNISQDALTKYNIIENAMSWSDFRDDRNHYEWIRDNLDRFNYPNSVRDDQTKTSIYEKAKFLKKHIDCGRKNTEKVASDVLDNSNDASKIEAAEIIMNIIQKAKKQKIEYIDHISSKEVNKNNLRKFTYLLLSGYATEEDIKERIDMPINEIQAYDDCKYIIYNGYKNSMKVEKEDKTERVEILLSDKDIDIDFAQGQSGFDITVDGDVLLRGQYHWKNKFQGVQTPCINIFHNK